MSKFSSSRQEAQEAGCNAVAAAHTSSDNDDDGVDEHTRLLPNRLDGEGTGAAAPPHPPYLSPDDPAVSPYNLFSVRLVRALTVALALASFLWWTLLLVAAFATPPGLHTRGSGFTAFIFASLALVTLGVSLAFFAAPSRATRFATGTAAALLAVGTVLELSVARVRHQEAWAGVASALWALLVVVWALAADATVAWGKTEEEKRLTGRPETRRTLVEWTEVLVSTVAMAVIAVAALMITLTLVLRALDAGLAPPGEMYWVDGNQYQIHLYCAGNASTTEPTVLLEGGEEPVEHGLWQFAENMLKNGSISRYCFADRPGIAWSDAAPSPFSASIASDSLSEALARAGETGPWVLLSAGVGSAYSRVFSARHGAGAVRGLLLVDPLHEDLLATRVGGAGRGLALWLRGVAGPLGWDRLGGAVFGGRGAADRTWGRAAGQGPKTIFARLQECLVADSLTRRDVVASRAIQERDVPLVVVSSGEEIRQDGEWEGKQRDLTRLTERLEAWDVVDKAPHQVWKAEEGRERIERWLRKLVRLQR